MDPTAAAAATTSLAASTAASSSRAGAKVVANLLSAETFYENFLELLAQLTSLCLTDEETESIASSLKRFHATLQRVSSRSSMSGSPTAWRVGGSGSIPSTPIADDDSPWEVPKPLRCHHAGTCVQHCTRGWLRSFAVGYMIKYAVGTLPLLFSPRKLLARPDLLRRELNRDTVQFALFLSSFTSGYKALYCALRRAVTAVYAARPHWWADADRPAFLKKIAAFLAGTLASAAILLDRNKTRRTAICLYFLTRAIEFQTKYNFTEWRKNRELRRLGDASPPPPLESADSAIGITPRESATASPVPPSSPPSPKTAVSRVDQARAFLAALLKRMDDKLPDFLAGSAGVVTMMLASSQILFAYVAMPDTLAQSYMSFLLTHGGQRDRMGPLVAHALRLMGRTVWRTSGHADKVDLFCPMPHGAGTGAGPMPLRAGDRFNMCAMIHPDTPSCAGFSAKCFVTSFIRSAKLYAPLNLAMTLVLGSKRARKAPLQTMVRLVTSTVRSSTFLAGYVMTAWTATCIFRNATGTEHISFYLVNGMLSGAWSLIEAPSRRLELGLYCLPRALESLWRALIILGVLPRVPRDAAERAAMPVAKRALATVLTDKRVGEPLYFALSTGLLMALYEAEPHIISPGYKNVMTRFFGVN
ncbi:hypothetical protein H9P43_005856 [Blastocladiella emersonii ATCC 22665]|nr:hypothetical protein H9P43_005856 [Blastocladiella emersonii ATCC 22665]